MSCCERHVLNPLNPKSDQHQISPCNINAFVKQSGHENITDTITQNEFAWYAIIFSPLPLLEVNKGNMRIQILILGLKGLNKLSTGRWLQLKCSWMKIICTLTFQNKTCRTIVALPFCFALIQLSLYYPGLEVNLHLWINPKEPFWWILLSGGFQ